MIVIICGIALAIFYIYYVKTDHGYKPSEILPTLGIFILGAIIGCFFWVIGNGLFASTCPNSNHLVEVETSYELNEIQNGKYVLYSDNYFYFASGSEIRRVYSNYALIEHSTSGKPVIVESTETSNSTFLRFLLYPLGRPIYTLYIPEDSIIFKYNVNF